MLLDLLDTSNSLIINLDLIKLLGLSGAAYCSEILSIFKKANRKQKLIDNKFFKVDRAYIENQITLNKEDQLAIDNKLIKIDLMSKYNDDSDIITLNIDLLASLVACEDEKTLNKIKKAANTRSKSDQTKAKKQVIIDNLKNSLVCSNDELLNALKEWIDSLYEKPNGYLTKAMVKNFQHDLNQYTKGDLDLALDIVKTATLCGYAICQYAINKYNQNMYHNNLNKPRVVEQKTATKETINQDITF